MQPVLPVPSRRSLAALILAALLCPPAGAPARAFDLFAAHRVTAHFATPAGKPMADAEVRVYAPGETKKPALTGRTDAEGKFAFDADRDGFWTAEARTKGEVARVMIRVPAASQRRDRIPPLVMIGGLALLLILVVWYRVLRARTRGPPA